jgi:hypothetical protein
VQTQAEMNFGDTMVIRIDFHLLHGGDQQTPSWANSRRRGRLYRGYQAETELIVMIIAGIRRPAAAEQVPRRAGLFTDA